MRPSLVVCTMGTTLERAPDASILAWTCGIATVWFIAALLRSGTTLHLGPLLLPMIPAILGRGTEHAIQLTMIGIVAGMVVIVLLFLTGYLNGPSLGTLP